MKQNTEKLFIEASKHNSRIALVKASRSTYMALRKIGLLDEACKHMPISPKYSYKKWNKKDVAAEAAKYASRSQFKRENAGAYEFALANNLLESVCDHMQYGHHYWHMFELMAVAKKYRSWHDFIAKEPKAYQFCNKNKLSSIASAHMIKLRTDWDKSAVLTEALKYTSRGMFQSFASGAYKHADKFGYMDEACQHMPVPEYGFQKEKTATLYHLRIETAEGLVLYKVGITNREVQARIKSMGVPDGTTVDVLNAILFERGRDARITEKRLHRKNKGSRYLGPAIMKNGNTELFTVAVIE